MTSRSLLFFGGAGGAGGAMSALVMACGGAPLAQAPKVSEPDPMTIEEAQAQISRARTELGDVSVNADAASPPPPPAAAPAAEPSTAKPESMKKSDAPASSLAGDSQCTSPCRALASMRRAVTALCRMTGDEDGRCRDARKTLQSSEARVTPCSC